MYSRKWKSDHDNVLLLLQDGSDEDISHHVGVPFVAVSQASSSQFFPMMQVDDVGSGDLVVGSGGLTTCVSRIVIGEVGSDTKQNKLPNCMT